MRKSTENETTHVFEREMSRGTSLGTLLHQEAQDSYTGHVYGNGGV